MSRPHGVTASILSHAVERAHDLMDAAGVPTMDEHRQPLTLAPRVQWLTTVRAALVAERDALTREVAALRNAAG